MIAALMLVPVQAKSDIFSVHGHAKAIVGDNDRYKNDIKVSILLVARLPEGLNEVFFEVSVEGPEGEGEIKEFSIEFESKADGNSLQKIETVFDDIASVKGFYYVDVSASSGELADSFSFKFDPPGGTMGPPRR